MLKVDRTTRHGGERSGGFTLLELLIIAVVLAVISLRVIPRMTAAAGDDREAKLVTALQLLRSQLELYAEEHRGESPAGDVTMPVNPEAFMRRLTTETTPAHRAGEGCGPYMYALPVNPFNQKNTVRYAHKGGARGTDEAGWVFELETGTIYSDDAEQTVDGAVAHRDY